MRIGVNEVQLLLVVSGQFRSTILVVRCLFDLAERSLSVRGATRACKQGEHWRSKPRLEVLLSNPIVSNSRVQRAVRCDEIALKGSLRHGLEEIFEKEMR